MSNLSTWDLVALFFILLFLLFHSYVLYPILIKFLAQSSLTQSSEYQTGEDLPVVYLLLSVHNEEKLMEEKIRNLMHTSYPLEKIQVLVGADNCTDGTISILQRLKNEYPQLNYISYPRIGKGNVMNQLMHEHVSNEDSIVVFTDANVFFDASTIYNLVKKFKDPEIGLVGGWIVNEFHQSEIGAQEDFYIQKENIIKHHEGQWGGNLIGAFGACFAIRAHLYTPTPNNFITDDFFISMAVLRRGAKAIIEPTARCVERINPSLKSEFKRKCRYAAGNFQNLFYFKDLWFKGFQLSFCFWSHKIIRWLAPFFILICLGISIAMMHELVLFKWMLLCFIVVFSTPILAAIANYLKFESKLLKFASYFIWMNIALMIGFINYLKGIKTNVWTPTERV